MARLPSSPAKEHPIERTASSFSTSPIRPTPKSLSEYTETVTGGVHSAFVNGHYVYLTDDATGSLRVIDFADPAKIRKRWRAGKPRIRSRARSRPRRRNVRSADDILHDVQVVDGLIVHGLLERRARRSSTWGTASRAAAPSIRNSSASSRFNYRSCTGRDGSRAPTRSSATRITSSSVTKCSRCSST